MLISASFVLRCPSIGPVPPEVTVVPFLEKLIIMLLVDCVNHPGYRIVRVLRTLGDYTGPGAGKFIFPRLFIKGFAVFLGPAAVKDLPFSRRVYM